MKPIHVVVVCVLAAICVPWALHGRYVFHVATLVALTIPMALSLNLMLRLGQLTLAQPAFMGIGAYGSALLAARVGVPTTAAVLVGGVIAALFAAAVGPIFLRIKGVFFVLLTFSFSQIVNLIFQEWSSLTGGNGGLYGLPKLSILGLQITTPNAMYPVALLFALLVFAVMIAMERSAIGAIFGGLNEDEMMSRSFGSNALSWRVAAFTFSGFIAGVSGGLYAFYIGYLSPEAFGLRQTISLIVINSIGGATSALGPLLGTILVVPLPEFLRDAQQYQQLSYGICLILFLKFMRRGLVSLVEVRGNA